MNENIIYKYLGMNQPWLMENTDITKVLQKQLTLIQIMRSDLNSKNLIEPYSYVIPIITICIRYMEDLQRMI